MFDLNNIVYSPECGQYICSCQCASSSDAENLVASWIHISRVVPVGEIQ